MTMGKLAGSDLRLSRKVSGPSGITHLLSALRYSAQGIAVCFKEEIAFRQECMMAVPYFIAVVCLPLELLARLYLAALWFVLIAVELLNTAIEAVVNLVSPEWNVLAKKAKDCGSAAVFVIMMLLVISWSFVGIRLAKGFFG